MEDNKTLNRATDIRMAAVLTSLAMYTFVTDEFKRLQGFISQLDSRLLRLEQAEASRRESGWSLYMPTDLSD